MDSKRIKQTSPFLKMNLTFDVLSIIDELTDLGLLDFGLYRDFEITQTSPIYAILNGHRKMYEKSLGTESHSPAEKYRQHSFSKICLSEANPSSNQLSRRDSYEFEKRNVSLDLEKIGPEIAKVLEHFKDLGRVRLAAMMPSCRIEPHVDYGKHMMTRVHIPLITNPDCWFYTKIGGTVYRMHLPANGSAYSFNVGRKHWAENLGTSTRLHLLIDSFDTTLIDQFHEMTSA